MTLVIALVLTVATDSPLLHPDSPGRGRVLRAQPEPALGIAVTHARLRVVEIDAELGGLLVRPGIGEVFWTRLKTVAPWMGIGLIPLAGGLAYGLMGPGASLSIPLTKEHAIVYPVIGIGSFALAGLLVAFFATVSYFIDEAEGAPTRQVRIDVLRAERASLAHVLW